MNWSITEFAVTPGESINWLSIIIGLIGLIGTIIGIIGVLFGVYIRFYDRKDMRKATLYFPLFLACRGIVEIVEDYDTLGEDCSRNLFASCAKTLDEIVYTHGSIIHLKRADDLDAFLSLKKAIDENLEFIEQRNWVALKSRFKSDEFKKAKGCAEILLSSCKEEVKDIKELPE